MPPLRPCKNNSLKDGGQRWLHRFHVSRPPLDPLPKVGRLSIIWQHFCRKLHENEKEMDWGGVLPGATLETPLLFILISLN